MQRTWILHQRHTGKVEVVTRERIFFTGPWIIFDNDAPDDCTCGVDVFAVNGEDYYKIEEVPDEKNPEEPLGAEIKIDQNSEEDMPLPGFETYGSEKQSVYLLSDDDIARMKEYHLDDLRDEDTSELLGFICTGINGTKRPCGMQYPSIEDRMLRDPEHCSGCFVMMGQG